MRNHQNRRRSTGEPAQLRRRSAGRGTSGAARAARQWGGDVDARFLPIRRGRRGRATRRRTRSRGAVVPPRGAPCPGPPATRPGRPGRPPTWSRRFRARASPSLGAPPGGRDAAHHGQHVVMAAGTASASLGYQLPALSAVKDRPRRPWLARRDRCTSPDQGTRPGPAWPGSPRSDWTWATTHDGDSGRAAGLSARPRGVRPHQPRHASSPLLPGHARWRASRVVVDAVVDECHHYRRFMPTSPT